jgi:myo-inositol-1(or 4)-monophosphatase
MEPMLTIALRAARAAADIIFKSSEKAGTLKVAAKGNHDFVTQVDLAAEKTIIHTLRHSFPEHGILAEESGLQPGEGAGKDYLWIIDPLDGTTNFIHGLPYYAVSIACQVRGRIQHAVVLDPMAHDEFTASRGKGAQLNGKRIRVSGCRHMESALLATGFPFRPGQYAQMDHYMKMFTALARSSAGIRRAGASALDLAYVAAGRYDAFWEFGLKPWDIAAGSLLVQEAGGLVSDFTGGNNHLETGTVICGTPKCFKAVAQAIHPFVTPEMSHC